MRLRGFIVAIVISCLLVLSGFRGTAVAESADVTEAFSRLDALSEELLKRRRALEERGLGVSPAPAPAPPAVVAPAPAPSSGIRQILDSIAGKRSKAKPCGSRQEMTKRISELQGRYKKHSTAIIDVNDQLPTFRKGVLNIEHVCAKRLTDDIASAMGRVKVLDVETDREDVNILTACVDRLREKTNDELKATKSNIRLQRLAAEMERLGSMTHRVADIERALLRGISKRDRLVQELGQFQEEIKAECQ